MVKRERSGHRRSESSNKHRVSRRLILCVVANDPISRCMILVDVTEVHDMEASESTRGGERVILGLRRWHCVGSS